MESYLFSILRYTLEVLRLLIRLLYWNQLLYWLSLKKLVEYIINNLVHWKLSYCTVLYYWSIFMLFYEISTHDTSNCLTRKLCFRKLMNEALVVSQNQEGWFCTAKWELIHSGNISNVWQNNFQLNSCFLSLCLTSYFTCHRKVSCRTIIKLLHLQK